MPAQTPRKTSLPYRHSERVYGSGVRVVLYRTRTGLAQNELHAEQVIEAVEPDVETLSRAASRSAAATDFYDKTDHPQAEW